MANITEYYVSFETAKLLKNKGFEEETIGTYYVGGNHDGKFEEEHRNNWNKYFKTPIAAPTHQMAMRWLREVHKIFIQIEIYDKWENYTFELFQNTHRLMLDKMETFGSPEKACEDAIKYCLEKLI